MATKRFPIGLDSLAKAAAPKKPIAVQARGALDGASKPPLTTRAPERLPERQLERSPDRLTDRMSDRMVDRIAATGWAEAAVLDAMRVMPRDRFIASALAPQAYEDTALPIGHGQTISKPSIVARMLTLAEQGAAARRLGHLGRTLEIGTGCGYQAAVLSLLASSVMSVERLRALHDLARDNLAQVAEVRRGSLRLVLGDGRLGHPPNAPYDTIIAAAVGSEIPSAWLEQLAPGGRLVTPQSAGDEQVLVVVDHTERGFERSTHESVRFVPLESGVVR
jgi:protein-L-isoaspartate(D-aspartate) O-methyltransferase